MVAASSSAIANVAFATSAVDVASAAGVVASDAVVVVVVVADAANADHVVAPAIAEDGPPLQPLIVDRSRLAKLELRVEKYPPSKPDAPAICAGSWACSVIFAHDHSPWSLRARTSRSC